MAALLDPSVLADRLLARELPDRYAHVVGVATRAREVVTCLDFDGQHLVAAAWLHDIGYAPSLVQSGFHPLDGARYVGELGYAPGVVSLVAFHSGAQVEAELRGLGDILGMEFHEPDPEELGLLTYCDLTTGPRGQPMTFDERVADILIRYEADHVVHRSIRLAETGLRESLRDVEMRLAFARSQSQ